MNERFKSIKCYCGCKRELDFTKRKLVIIPKDHRIDLVNMRLIRTPAPIRMPNYMLN